jgi:hypothetical protein
LLPLFLNILIFLTFRGAGLAYQEVMGLVGFENHKEPNNKDLLLSGNSTWLPIHYQHENGEKALDPGPGPYVVTWITSPVLAQGDVNYNLFRDPLTGDHIKKCLEEETVVFGGFELAPKGDSSSPNAMTAFFATLHSFEQERAVAYLGDPMGRLFLPVYNNFQEDRKVVAVTTAMINWRHYFTNLLPETMQGIVVVLENECDGSFTYEVNGPSVDVMGFGNLHEPTYVENDQVGSFEEHYLIKDGSKQGLSFHVTSCAYRLRVYPSKVRNLVYPRMQLFRCS